MQKKIKIIILLLICFFPFLIAAQEAKPEQDKAPASSRMQRKKAKQKWKENRINEKAQAKGLKDYHKKLQTKKTNKWMRKQKRKSEKLRTNKKEFFIIRWLKYGRH